MPTQDAYSKPHQLSLDWSLDFDQGLWTEFKETKKKGPNNKDTVESSHVRSRMIDWLQVVGMACCWKRF